MKRFSFFYILLASCTFYLLQSCTEKDPTPDPGAYGKLRVGFDNIVGNKNLVLNGFTYQNALGEDFTISKFNYFVSNFKLIKSDGSTHVIPQDSSYFLIREDVRESQTINLNNIPLGDYTGLEFMVGVDSLRSASPIAKRTGVLDAGGDMGGDGMWWSWNSGYVFVKLEGSSPVAAGLGKFYYHIGLYGGYDKPTVNNTRIVKINFEGHKASVTNTATAEVHLFADVMKIFNGPNKMSIAVNNSIMGGQQQLSQQVANNYSQMFSLGEIHAH